MKQYLALLLWALCACSELAPVYTLPIYGEKKIVAREGSDIPDTLYHRLPDFTLYNQEGLQIKATDYDGFVYVADFFFTSCPTICPLMKTQMVRLYDKFENEPNLKFLSFSIDPEHDSVETLNRFARSLGISSERWNMLTGNRDSIFALAQGEYLVTAKADASEPGGYIHSGAFILVDRQRRIRGYYDGTKESEVNRLMADIKVLLLE